MGFGEAIRSGFAHYADFSGRASRSAYWWWTLFTFVAVFAVAFAGALLFGEDGANGFGMLAYLAVLVPSLAVMVRRLHDTDRSGWWALLNLVPFVGGLVVLVFLLMPGAPGPNRFGMPESERRYALN